MKIPRELPNLELINEIYSLEDNHIKVIFFLLTDKTHGY